MIKLAVTVAFVLTALLCPNVLATNADNMPVNSADLMPFDYFYDTDNYDYNEIFRVLTKYAGTPKDALTKLAWQF